MSIKGIFFTVKEIYRPFDDEMRFYASFEDVFLAFLLIIRIDRIYLVITINII